MHWFQSIAPIRLKLLVAFGFMVGVLATVVLAALFAPKGVFIGVAGLAIVISALLGARFRDAIADPYVATVVRMEGLAAGDLARPIPFTDYQDCVGRISKAMIIFRDAALKQKAMSEQQTAVVQVMSSHLAALRDGDLTAEIHAEFAPEYAELKTNFNLALGALRDLIGSVGTSAGSIRVGSDEIAQASDDLARRTESSAASLAETSASLAQIDSRLKASTTAAGRTVERANEATGIVAGGRTIADEAVQAMGRVSDSAKGIDSVIEGLDKIAFQTRVLAMNAAVEAGRAGEAGRGFAVVADLVSALAMRAEEEAGRARDQLTAAQTEIGTAVEAVRRVDGALADISGAVTEVHDLLDTMAADNLAQSSAMTQISVAVSSMDQSTQQNAAMVEQTSAAARNLAGEVTALSEQTALFEIGGSVRGVAAVRHAIKPARVLDSPMGSRRAPTPERVLALGGDDWNAF